MIRPRGSGVEAGLIGVLMGLLLAGPLTILLVAILLPVSYVFGDEPNDGSLAYSVLALPLALLICLAAAFYLAQRSGGYRSLTVASAGLGFAGFWTVVAAVVWSNWL